MNTACGRHSGSVRLATLALAGVLTIAWAGSPAVADAAVDPVSPAEQWLVYELNRARWSPTAYAAEFGVTPGAPVSPQPPLAVNNSLFSATGFKAQQTFEYPSNFQSSPSLPNYHCSNATGTWVCPNGLAVSHGFPLPSNWPLDQNFIEVYWGSTGSGTPRELIAAFMASPGHVGVMFQWPNYEIGAGQYDACAIDSTRGCNFIFMHLTPRSPIKLFVTGVVFSDGNGNGVMDIGEGLAGVTVTAAGRSTTTNGGGGYAIPAGPGNYTVTASGAGFPTATASATVTSYNVSVDFTAGASSGTTRAYELCDGLEPTLLGTGGPDILVGTSGDDVIHGLDGDDVISGGGGNDVICGGGGLDTINGTAEPSRLAGADRYATGVEVSRYSHPGHTDVVYLAVGTNYPDAIAAGPAAASEGAPILLVSPTGIPSTTRDELLRLSPHRVVILGGTAAIPEAVLDQVANLLPGAGIERRWGATRYETAAEVSAAAFSGGVGTVFVATGQDFADALIVAPIAATTASPLLLVRPTGIPAAVAAELTRLSPERIIVIGSTAAISDAVLDQLDAYAPATRVDARDRYALSATVSGLMYPAGAPIVYVATGSTFPDALTAGPGTVTAPGPLLLVNGSIPAAVAAELERLNPESIIILGGTAAVSNAIAEQLIAYLG